MKMNVLNLDEVCRICLTTSPHMVSLASPLKDNVKVGVSDAPLTILSVLEQVISQKFITHEYFPSQICSKCRNSLIKTYEFRILFLNSQFTLESVLKKIDPSFMKNENAELEIILGDEKFNLKDVFIIENEEEDKDCFDGILENLGNTAVFVNKENGQPDSTDNDFKKDISKNEASETSGSNAGNKSPTESKEKAQLGKNIITIKKDVAPTVNISENKRNVAPKGEKCAGQQTKRKKASGKRQSGTSQKRVILCDICGHVNRGVHNANNHRLTHSGKTFQCHLCPKGFFYRMSLGIHLKIHQNKRKYLCTICGANFNWQSSLTYHMRMHNNDRKYVCEHCNKDFYMQSTWKRHLRVHTDERPYTCVICGKGFRSNGEKRRHEWIHIGYKPHKCRYCEKTFSSKYNLLVHHMSYSGEHACDYCFRTFKEPEFLKKHIKMKHGIEPC